MEPRYLSVKEVAALTGTNIKTIYRMIQAGELPARRFRRSLRVPRYAVEPRSSESGKGDVSTVGPGSLCRR